MKHLIRGAVLMAGIVLGLALAAPASADSQATSQDVGKLTEEEQRIFAKQQENNPWYDPSYGGGGPGGSPGGNNGGGVGGGDNGGAVVPEPGTIALLGLGLGALGVARRRQKAGQQS
ncbi:MAG TPA: PEP-CTERM sorting domain-containing protein [bacterium]|nr:PEP-CTERM sorting domain-containing protein [bacterium]